MQNEVSKFSELIRKSKDPQSCRYFLVKYSLEHGIKETIRYFSTTRKTVRLWLKRYSDFGYEGLLSQSKRPKSSPKRMNSEAERLLKEELNSVRKNKKRLIISQVQFRLNLPYSLVTLRKKSREWGFSKSFTKKRERKRNLTEMKAKYKPFEKIQVDVKYLDDIPEFYNDYKECNLPRYQITARCIRTGALFFSYCYEKSITNTTIFQRLLLDHLNSFGVVPRKIQTDNGSEFTTNRKSNKISLFTKELIEKRKIEHGLIPPGAKTWQSDVETSHRLIEDEFYSQETFSGKKSFLEKSYNYLKQFNYNRFNSYKNGTPLQIMKTADSKLNSEILNFRPVITDHLLRDYFLKENKEKPEKRKKETA